MQVKLVIIAFALGAFTPDATLTSTLRRTTEQLSLGGDRGQRLAAGRTLIDRCCAAMGRKRKPACDAATAPLLIEQDATVLHALAFDHRGLACVGSSFSVALRLCRHGCSAEQERLAAKYLESARPERLLSNASSVAGDERIDATMREQLGYGYGEMSQILTAQTVERIVRFAPVEAPLLLTELRRTSRWGMPSVGIAARRAAAAYVEARSQDPAAVVERLMRIAGRGERKLEVISVLARRKFSCRTELAAEALRRLGHDRDRRISAAARQGLRVRSATCRR